MTIGQFLDSNLVAAVFTVIAGSSVSTLIMVVKLLVKFGALQQRVTDIDTAVAAVKSDSDVVRWSQIGPNGMRASRRTPRMGGTP
jgi:hypothetical protein